MSYEFTPSDLMDLRHKMKSIGTLRCDFTAEACGVPFVVYSAPTKEWCLQGQGLTLAVSTRPEVICWLLAQERYEPGYVRSLLDPAYNVELALSPEKRAQAKREENAFMATLRAAEAQANADRARRRQQLNPPPAASVTLDDLLG